jgi:hypothetical protein
MNLEEIEITISPDGKVEVHVTGVKGDSCLEITDDLERALGGTIEIREMTHEAFEENQQNAINQDYLNI